ncbi:LPXTG cell wall anchor domain-containing protein [Ligilactobacillus sp. LYQ139]|uniref:LPXTG cell wall anchor domain-containing protein n=1 Tax=Ligilactobacillus sp. LYQ139 TaxID=3378800 RepID=UPI003853EACF
MHPATPAGVTPQHHQQQGNQLPDTGDSQHNDWWAIGGTLLAGAALLAPKKKREA